MGQAAQEEQVLKANAASRVDPKAALPPQAAELADSLGYLLRRLQLAYKKNFQRVAPDSVHPGMVATMFLIARNPEITPSQLSAGLGMEPTQITALLGRLQAQNLLSRPSSSDGRSRPVRLSPQGEDLFKEVETAALEAEDSFVAGILDPDEARMLRELLGKLLAGHAA